MKKGYLQSALTLLLILCMLGFLASCGPGGGSGNIDDPNGTEEPSDDDGSQAATPKKISLATSQVRVERGSHDELLAQRGFYHQLYTSQFRTNSTSVPE